MKATFGVYIRINFDFWDLFSQIILFKTTIK